MFNHFFRADIPHGAAVKAKYFFYNANDIKQATKLGEHGTELSEGEQKPSSNSEICSERIVLSALRASRNNKNALVKKVIFTITAEPCVSCVQAMIDNINLGYLNNIYCKFIYKGGWNDDLKTQQGLPLTKDITYGLHIFKMQGENTAKLSNIITVPFIETGNWQDLQNHPVVPVAVPAREQTAMEVELARQARIAEIKAQINEAKNRSPERKDLKRKYEESPQTTRQINDEPLILDKAILRLEARQRTRRIIPIREVCSTVIDKK